MHLLTYTSASSDNEEPKTLPIWLVNPETQVASELASSDIPSLNLTPYSTADVVSVGCSLSLRGLPLALVNCILDSAGVWVHHQMDTREVVEGWAPMEREYVRMTIPVDAYPSVHVSVCRALTIECVSHDQGWATDMPESNSTYFGCNSWVEFDVLDATGALMWPRACMCRNFRAHASYRRHILHITDSALLDRLTPGCHVIVYLRALVPGWSNHAKYGRVRVQYACALNDSFNVEQCPKLASTSVEWTP
ncbi:hypothetical protein DYB28_000219 [Aphanomyces astaci]|uniref:Uncharacterized protein n=1 Tax=Aphanomyces astaci TaxID=112090 RepID=A0A397EEP4_APHAT|nr:hypothetical protein DYB25_006088 [Aphanomyces astaci]RHY78798.1 hypothetical protein DYB38_005987 [Aphanomyces astaci]RLO05400.1 hypothetical protein DYB28_000219 [Aphanomyces astaci]